MKKNISFWIAIRELKNTPKFVFVFTINLALGLLGLGLVETFKSSFTDYTSGQSKTILGADLSVGGRFQLEEEKKKRINELLSPNNQARATGIFSMLGKDDISRLVYIRAIEGDFPFYGEIKVSDNKEFSDLKDDEVFVYPELLIELSLKLGDEVKLGDKSFKIAAQIIDDGGQAFRMSTMAPRLYMTKKSLTETNLIRKGSTVWYNYYYKVNGAENMAILKGQIEALISDNAFKVNIPETASTQVGRLIKYLNDYLGLTSVVALFLSLIGMYYLYRSFLLRRRKDIAILKCIGLSLPDIRNIYFMHLTLLAFLSVFLAISINQMLMPLLTNLVQTYLDIPVSFTMSSKVITVLTSAGVLSTLFFGVPMILNLTNLSAESLFHQEFTYQKNKFFKALLMYTPGGVASYLFAFYLSQSWIVSAIFIFTLVIFFILATPVLTLISSLLHRNLENFKLSNKLSLLYLLRNKHSTFAIFFVLAFSSLLMNTIASVYHTLSYELQSPMKSGGPSFFMFDIQQEQVSGIKKYFEDNDLKLSNISPMIRGRLLNVNGEQVKAESQGMGTREQEQSSRMRNRGINVSYREVLDPSEKIIEGVYSSDKYNEDDGLMKLSLEKRYAQRIGADIGDTLEFNIMDINFKGVVTSIRSVKWTSFMPNFFILVQPGVLDYAPKTFIAATGTIPDNLKVQTQTDIVKKFPNISIIDVGRLVTKIIGVMKGLYAALSVMAMLSIFVSLMVLWAVIQHQMQARTMDFNLMNILGISKKQIRSMAIKEYIFLGLMALGLGGGFGILVGYGMSVFIFESDPTFDWATHLTVFFIQFSFIFLISLIGTLRNLTPRPMELIQAQGN